ncbi:metallophosphoesterase family protein [Sulfobacillus harzensis]|uniref:Metallophosphoesterase n=1 Tax=Sulfobacillus harzensis TaxID=2729629 RepID=A0A7Y0L333_9FIRM|nr:metallophosphoesterase [Sulfobacillus harzensis]NMP22087.1 metallophosphoesterase [Sulfobacillus harzensis]
MENTLTRRGFMGGALAVATAALTGKIAEAKVPAGLPAAASLRIVHLSDFHWGYRGDWNRNLSATVDRILQEVLKLDPKPQLVLVTGDLIQAVGESAERNKRLEAVKAKLDGLNVPWLAVPGEHDTFGDQGQAFKTIVGPLFFHRNFQGLHVLGLDNVSQGPFLGQAQSAWVQDQLGRMAPTAPLVVLTHRPLYDLFTPWNWYTYDGDSLYGAISRFSHRVCLFGHVHQAISHRTHQTNNTSGLPASWPLPAPGPLERLQPWPQGASHPDMGLGFRVMDWTGSGFKVHTTWLESPQPEAVLT